MSAASKRNRSEMDIQEEIFLASKKTLRSPHQRQMMEERAKIPSLPASIEELTELVKTVLAETQSLRTEMKQLKQEFAKRETEWKQEKNCLESKIIALESNVERLEKRGRRNNIVVKGINSTASDKEAVVQLLGQQMQLRDVGIVHARTIYKASKGRAILARVESWEKKQDIMKAKNKLKGTQIYIDHDLTEEERRVQSELHGIAKERRANKDKVSVTYRKMRINGVMYFWSDERQGVVRAVEKEGADPLEQQVELRRDGEQE